MPKRTLAFIVIAAVLNLQASAQQVPTTGQIVQVRKNTVLAFTLVNALDSSRAKVGDEVRLRLSRPLIVDNVTLIPEGQVISGRVTMVQQAIPNKREGRIKWTLDEIPFTDSTSAKARIWFTRNDQFTVPEHYENGWPGEERVGAKDIPYIVMFILLFPIAFPVWLVERTGEPHFYDEYHLPANSTVAAVITKDHRVRY